MAAATSLRRSCASRQGRDGLGCRDSVVTRERPGSPSSSSSNSREEPLPDPHHTSISQVVAVVRLLLLWARAIQAVPECARSLGSCLHASVDGAGSRSVSRGLRSSQSSRELSRADRRQSATLVVFQATSERIAR
ncbi:hypothetical protein Taro_006695 [Colocasia esculenta]|uniref:Uncharacterized protein n=1 Tax=Colocasia esculenta TaxID=4460 RepID=A0A843TWS9_COLES|nr:hypothetical protein [Colocasia esculenta]